MKNDKKEKGFASDLIVSSIGACIASPDDKKKEPCVMVAYETNTEPAISLLMVPFLPKGGLHTRETLLQAIRAAEKVKHVTYTDAMGGPKDILFCRPGSGRITDVVERDYDKDSFTGQISEIYTGKLRFQIQNPETVVYKNGQKLNVTIIGASDNAYEENSYEYAAVNAYNACLLGHVFEREELILETKDERRVKIAVRPEKREYLEEDVLYVHPVFGDDGVTITHYITEPFQFIDGQTISARAYEIKYTNHLKDYNLVRV